MPYQIILSSLFVGVNLVIFRQAYSSVKQGGFYTDTPWLAPLGIFVWGDALIIAPFWVVMSLIGLAFPALYLLRFFLLFYAVRSAYEVVYWINHQVARRDYMPPLFRRFSWLKPNDAAILYQLINMVQMVVSLAALALTYA